MGLAGKETSQKVAANIQGDRAEGVGTEARTVQCESFCIGCHVISAQNVLFLPHLSGRLWCGGLRSFVQGPGILGHLGVRPRVYRGTWG